MTTNNHNFKLQKPELELLLRKGEITIHHRNEDKKLELELTEDVEVEKAETFKVTEE